ncbi:MAG: 3'(2'),5'-bisphosphate nucleotidase CysQ [Chitinophagales bacterium]
MKFVYRDIDIEAVVAIAKKAGDAIMEVYSRDFAVEVKDDKSPLTEADRKSNEVILQGLHQLYPAIPYISEEVKALPYEERKTWKRFWLIDPLDGTKEFIKRNGEFTVNIALIEDGVAKLGVVYAPALNQLFFGAEGVGAFKQEEDRYVAIKATAHYTKLQKVMVVASRSHLTDETLQFVDRLKQEGKEVDFLSSGSSLKFCLVAEGKADVYPRFGPTMEWDSAAAHAVVLYAGKGVYEITGGKPLVYNKESLLNPFFIVE